MPRLLVEHPDEPPNVVELRDGLTVGRYEAADIILIDEQISRHHLLFRVGPLRDYEVLDMRSAHGTRVNGARVERWSLKDGDVIEIGRIRIKFIDPVEASVIVQVKDAGPMAEEPPAGSEAARRLGVFYDVARAISQIEDVSVMLGRMLDAILDVLGCERGVIGLHDPSRGHDYAGRIVRVRGGAPPGGVIISRTIIETTMLQRKGVIASEGLRSKSFLEQNILSAMGVPLLSGPRVLGFIYVDDCARRARFNEGDLDFLGALAHLTAAAVESAERYQRAVTAVEVLNAASPLGELMGDSPPMQRLKTEIRKYAAAPSAHVLIRGESGTGKELVARTLHALSPRAGMPLVTLNCAAMPEAMVESELFGHVKGAFTGAISDKRGKFVLADGGTLFLDEIGDLSLAAQAKVLRAVQQGEVQPVGSEKTLRVNVRILSATHKDLAAEVAAGRFREDLLYRLNVLELMVPPLRERPEDIPRLAHAFLAEAARRMGKRVAGFTPQALAALVQHRFPGNVRELQNEAERAAIVVGEGLPASEAAVVDIGDLSARITGRARAPEAPRPEPSLAEHYGELERKERALVEGALEQARGSISEAARLLGISRSMMRVRMKRFGLDDGEAD